MPAERRTPKRRARRPTSEPPAQERHRHGDQQDDQRRQARHPAGTKPPRQQRRAATGTEDTAAKRTDAPRAKNADDERPEAAENQGTRRAAPPEKRTQRARRDRDPTRARQSGKQQRTNSQTTRETPPRESWAATRQETPPAPPTQIRCYHFGNTVQRTDVVQRFFQQIRLQPPLPRNAVRSRVRRSTPRDESAYPRSFFLPCKKKAKKKQKIYKSIYIIHFLFFFCGVARRAAEHNGGTCGGYFVAASAVGTGCGLRERRFSCECAAVVAVKRRHTTRPRTPEASQAPRRRSRGKPRAERCPRSGAWISNQRLPIQSTT